MKSTDNSENALEQLIVRYLAGISELLPAGITQNVDERCGCPNRTTPYRLRLPS